MASVVILKNITHRFGNVLALNDLTLSVREGEMFGFLGRGRMGFNPGQGFHPVRGDIWRAEPQLWDTMPWPEAVSFEQAVGRRGHVGTWIRRCRGIEAVPNQAA